VRKKVVAEIYRPLYLNHLQSSTPSGERPSSLNTRPLPFLLLATNHIHQRNRGFVRESGCRRAGSCGGHRSRQSNRFEVPARRIWFRRLVSKDVRALIKTAQDRDIPMRILEAVESVNEARKRYCEGPYECVENADATIIITEWEHLRALDLDRMRRLMAGLVIVDLRNIYRPEDVKKEGFAHACGGRDQPPTSTNSHIRCF
jgi:hypothetical protein